MSTEHPGIAVLREVTELLEQIGVKYWLGRGRFRHFVVTHEFGDEASDIDLHVLRADEAPLTAALPALRSRGYSITAHERHKLSIRKNSVDLEFVFLDSAGPTGSSPYTRLGIRSTSNSHVLAMCLVSMFSTSAALLYASRATSTYQACSARAGATTARAQVALKSHDQHRRCDPRKDLHRGKSPNHGVQRTGTAPF
jgi:hypothetical protein